MAEPTKCPDCTFPGPFHAPECYERQLAASQAALAKAEKAMRALESLTPGGSEYFEDPQRCVVYVRDAERAAMDCAKRSVIRAKQAEAQVARLQLALDATGHHPVEVHHGSCKGNAPALVCLGCEHAKFDDDFAEHERMRAALVFYADPGNWMPNILVGGPVTQDARSAVDLDGGRMAAAAAAEEVPDA